MGLSMADNNYAWVNTVAWILTLVAAVGAGVQLGEAGKESEFREKLEQERKKNAAKER